MQFSNTDQDNEFDGNDSDVDLEFRLQDEYQTNTRRHEEYFLEGDVTSETEEEIVDPVINSTPANTGRPKKERKRKYIGLIREENKRQRHAKHIHYKLLRKKKIKHYNCSCKIKCYLKIPTNVREEEFNRYQQLLL